MATNATWTIVFDDKTVINQSVMNVDGNPQSYKIDDDSFWNQSKFSNIWAIQYKTSLATDQVEYRDDTPHSDYDESALGPMQEFVTRWDAAHTAETQRVWDEDNLQVEDPVGSGTLRDETEAEKIARIGERPGTFTSPAP